MAVLTLDDGFVVELHVQPGARRNELIGMHGGRLKVKIAAPAIDGAANHATCAFIAELFDVPRASVRINRGHTSRQKSVVVSGTTSLPASIASLIAKH